MNKREAQELLPWYVAGTLSADETTAVRAFIDSGEIAPAELQELELFSEAVNEQSIEEPAYRPEILSDVMAQLDATPQHEAEPPLIVKEASPQVGIWQKLTQAVEEFSWSLTQPLAKVAIAGQFVLVVAIGGLLLSQSTTQEDAAFGTVKGSESASQADITIAVGAGVSEADFRDILLQLDAEIVAGPNAQGFYKIDVADDSTVTAALEALQASPSIDFVQPDVK